MSSQYEDLSSERFNQSKFHSLIIAADMEGLCKLLLKELNNSDGIKILNDIFDSFTKQDEYKENRQKLVIVVFDVLRKSKVSINQLNSVINRIVVGFKLYDKSQLTELVEYMIDRIRNNDDVFTCWKDVLPLLLERLEEEKFINYRGSDVSGKEYKIIIVELICNIDWKPSILVPLAKMFVELIADVNDKAIYETVMQRLTDKLLNLDVSQIPPMVYQMLRLGSKQNNIFLLSSLSKYFAKNYILFRDNYNAKESCNSISSNLNTLKELRETESTVLYYIYQSALDNSKSFLEYMRCLKCIINAPEYILDPFVMSVLLLLSNLYKDEALQILKTAFLRQVQNEEKQRCAWLRKFLSNDSYMSVTITHIIENSTEDRQLVLKGMIKFAFVLLSIERKTDTLLYLPWDYGCKIFQQVATTRHHIAGIILEELTNKIITSAHATQFTDCLAYMSRKVTTTVLEHQILIMTLLEQLLVIPGNVAMQVLRAILPLMRVSGLIRDNLIMILRKALYRKGTHTRQMAALGFLELLKNIRIITLSALSQSDSISSSNVASSSSIFTQATIERPVQRTSTNPWLNTNLCREILAILNKCFSHEVEVRCHLYKELYGGIIKNQELTDYVVEMLLEQLLKYYENDENIIPPINLHKCIIVKGVTVILQEPIAHLIFALQKIYLTVASKDSPRINKLAIVLESLCNRMAQTKLEHLGYDEDADSTTNTLSAEKNLLKTKITILIYESLIAYTISSWSLENINNGQSMIALYKGYSRFVEHLKKLINTNKNNQKSKKKKQRNKFGCDEAVKKPNFLTSALLPDTIMDLDTISKSLILLYSWTSVAETSTIRGRAEIHVFILQACLQLLQVVNTLKDYELKNYIFINKENFTSIGKTLFKHIISNLISVNSLNDQLPNLGLECFKECCNIMCTICPSELPVFLAAICEIEYSNGLSIQLQELISRLKDIFISILKEEENTEFTAKDILLYLLDIVFILVQKLKFAEVEDEQVFLWLKDIATSQEKMDVPVVSMVLKLILLIEEGNLEYVEIIQYLSEDICTILGKTDKTQDTVTRRFIMINETNIYEAYIAVNKVLSSKLQDMHWLLAKLNAEHIAFLSFKIEDHLYQERIKGLEQNLCRQFSFILGIFEVLASAKIVPGQASEAVFKNLQRVYVFACSLAKYFRKKSTTINPAFQAAKFIPVVQGAGYALKKTVTELILHIESSQDSGNLNDTNAQRNKILKEVMVIPGVVQVIDMFDKEIVLLTKKTGVDLSKYTKYDVIRDFRIRNSQLLENLEKMNVSLVSTQPVNNSNKNDMIQDKDFSSGSDEISTEIDCL